MFQSDRKFIPDPSRSDRESTCAQVKFCFRHNKLLGNNIYIYIYIIDHQFHTNLLYLKQNFVKHAFSVAAPRIRNDLPITLKTFETIALFQKNL